MDHNYVRSEDFNILTRKYDPKKGTFNLSGEVKVPFAVGDTINYIVNEEFDILSVTKITERRDSRDYPKGNGYFYRAVCGVIANPNPPVKKEEEKKKL
jgi:hypothetical protein